MLSESVCIESPVDEARALHGHDPAAPKSVDRNDYFFVCSGDERRGTKFRQNEYSLDLLEPVIGAIGSAQDVYLSQSSFSLPLRRRSAVKSTRAVWADLDCKKELDVEPETFLPKVHARLAELGLGLPTYSISSGNGLHLKWILREPVRAPQDPIWSAVQKTVSSLLRDLAADPKVSDPTRVLRVLHSTNSGARDRGRDGIVQMLHQTGSTYSLADMSASMLDIPEEQFERISRGRNVLRRNLTKIQEHLQQAEAATDFQQLEHYVDSREAVMRSDALYQLNWGRFIDLRDLAIMRGGFRRGERDIFLFWMVTHLALSRVILPHNFHAEVEALLKAFPVAEDFNPIEAGYLSTLERRISWTFSKSNQQRRKNYIYTPTTDTLINLLGISDSEMSMLSTLISRAERERRNLQNPRLRTCTDALQAIAQQREHEGRSSSIAAAALQAGTSRSKLYREFPQTIRQIQQNKARAREKDKAQALELSSQGLSQRQIAKQIGRPLSTVSLWLRAAAEGTRHETPRNAAEAHALQLGRSLAPVALDMPEEGLEGTAYIDAVMQQQRREREQLRNIDDQRRQSDLTEFVAQLTENLKQRRKGDGVRNA